MSRLPSLRAISFAAVIIWPDHEYSAVLAVGKADLRQVAIGICVCHSF